MAIRMSIIYLKLTYRSKEAEVKNFGPTPDACYQIGQELIGIDTHGPEYEAISNWVQYKTGELWQEGKLLISVIQVDEMGRPIDEAYKSNVGGYTMSEKEYGL